jgi:putative hydrolase of the HAD superfamily
VAAAAPLTIASAHGDGEGEVRDSVSAGLTAPSKARNPVESLTSTGFRDAEPVSSPSTLTIARVAAISFDAMGTLIELDPPAPHLARALRIPLADAERAIAAEISYYRAHLDEGRDAETVADLRCRCARVLAGELSVDADLTDVLLESLRFNVFADVVPALTRLRAAGASLVVVSNWDVSLHDVLARLGLATLLDAIVTSAEAGARKPNPAIFEAVGWPIERHVGDSEDEDVAGALAAGIEPVLIRRDGGLVRPGVTGIASLAEL